MAIVLICGFFSVNTYSQQIAIKTNLLYDATLTMNLGLEIAISPRVTVDISGSYNPWELQNEIKTKLWMIQPEFRFWFCKKFSGHFLGVHGLFSTYNMSGMLPMYLKPDFIKNSRYQGDLYGGGFSYGYQWTLSNRFSIEATLGVGYVYSKYSEFEQRKCGRLLGDGVKHFVGPTKLGLTLIYFIK